MWTPVSAMRRLAAAGAVLMALAASAGAVDTAGSSDAPDLTAVRAMIKAKRFIDAREELYRLADTYRHADVFNLLGFALRKSGDYTRALTYYRKALDFDPDHRGAHEYLGELYVETGQPQKAREQLAILVRLCPRGCEEREDLERALRAAGITIP